MFNLKAQLLFFFSLIFLPFAIVTGAEQNPGPSTEEKVDQIVAIVNDEIITRQQLDTAVKQLKAHMASQKSLPSDEVLRKQMLNQLIDQRLQLQMATAANLVATPTEIEAAVKKIAQSNHTTVSDLYLSMEKQGYSKKKFYDEIKNELSIHAIQQQEVAAHIVVPPQEVKELMASDTWREQDARSFHVKNILIELPVNPSPSDIALAESHAKKIMGKIQKTHRFSQEALASSSDTHALLGGDLGWRKLAELPDAFIQPISQMKKGDIRGPIRTPNGFHIIQLVDIKINSAKVLPTDEKERQKMAAMFIFEKKYTVALENWLRHLRKDSYIKIQ